MSQKLPRVLFLQLDQARVEERNGFREAELLGVLHVVAGLEGSSDVEIQIGVDAALFQLRDQIVEPVERAGVEVAAVGVARVDDSARRSPVEMVYADAVDAEARQVCGHVRRLLFGRQARGEREVDAPDAQPLAITLREMATAKR